MYLRKGLVTGNTCTRATYENPISYHKKVISNVKMFDGQTYQKINKGIEWLLYIVPHSGGVIMKTIKIKISQRCPFFCRQSLGLVKSVAKALSFFKNGEFDGEHFVFLLGLPAGTLSRVVEIVLLSVLLLCLFCSGCYFSICTAKSVEPWVWFPPDHPHLKRKV